MLKQIRETIHREDFLNGGQAEEMFSGMLDEELAKVMAGAGATGLTDVIYRQMLRFQGGADTGDAGASPGMPGATPQADALRRQIRSLSRDLTTPDAAPLPGDNAGR